MQLVKSVIRPDRVEAVKDALERAGIPGLTVTEVRGHGQQKGRKAVYRGRAYLISLLPKMQVECVVADHLVEPTIEAIITAARTGESDDGRVFVTPVVTSYKIRTGERE